MLYDLCLGALAYVGVSLWVGEAFQGGYFVLALIFALLPDLDFIPYLLLRQRFNLATHWYIHFPLLYILLGGILMWSFPYVGALFLIGTLGHLVHDLFSEPEETYPIGLQWLYPFSKTALAWRQGHFVSMQSAEREAQLKRRRETWPTETRHLGWEIRTRMEKISKSGAALIIVTLVVLFWFIFRNT